MHFRCLALGGATLLVSLLSTRLAPAQEQSRVKHILVATEAEAAQIRDEITKAGGDRKAFTAACRKYSKDAVTKRLGGSLGWVSSTTQFHEPFKAAALGLDVGVVSEPVKTPDGWHLIFVQERRGREDTLVPTNEPHDHDHGGHDHGHDHPHGDHDHDHDHDHGHDHPQGATNANKPAGDSNAATTATSGETGAATKVERPAPPRTTRPKEKVIVTLELAKLRRSARPEQLNFRTNQPLELNIYSKNAGSEAITVFDPSLLPLGLEMRPVGTQKSLTADFSSISAPAEFFSSVAPFAISGVEVSLNDYFQGIEIGRYHVLWNRDTFFSNLESSFPKAKDFPGYAQLKMRLTRGATIQVDRTQDGLSPRKTFGSEPLSVSVFDTIDPTKTYYAKIKVTGLIDPIIIELDQKQTVGVKHFVFLALSGFYDGLGLFDLQQGDYFMAGSPTQAAAGVPNMSLPTARNDAGLKHERGTVSFVGRRVRKGPVRGGQIGSIFFVTLKDHPEWDEVHVPFGKVVSDLSILDNVIRVSRFEHVTIVTDLGDGKAADGASDQGPAVQAPEVVRGDPEAVIKTAKGTITVRLFEREARNTVANFVNLVEDGFYDKDAAGSGKQTFFHLLKGAAGEALALQLGSPTNDAEGGPGYTIPSEPSTKKHTRGMLSMVQRFLPAEQRFEPDSAGSQFIICLDSIPYYDTLGLTVFGQVTEGLDIVDELKAGDEIESITITKKQGHKYNLRKS